MKSISPDDLICMDDFASENHYRVELAYAQENNLLFGERIYKPNAKLWLHKILADIVFEASNICSYSYGLRLVCYDGLRTVEAQQKMFHTKKAQENPHWVDEKIPLLSKPGGGGHPRAMAVDLGLETKQGETMDMGSPFDYLANNALPEHNIAHREYKHPQSIINNRKILDQAMRTAAKKYKTPLLELPQEWWDFRLFPETYNEYAALWDADLPENMRLL